MRLSLSAITVFLLASSGPLTFVSAGANAAVKPDTTPDSAPTKAARQVQPRQSSPNLLGSLYQLAKTFNLRACIPEALPLVTTLPKIPPGLLGGAAVSQALTQTTRSLGDVCDFSITGSVGDTFTSFLPTWYSWYNRYSDSIANIATKCSAARGLVRTVEAYETCPQVVAQITATSVSGSVSTSAASTGVDTTGTVVPTTVASSETAPTETTETPAEAKESGFFGTAAAAVAGVLGIVAVL